MDPVTSSTLDLQPPGILSASTRPTVLAIGDGAAPTGFSRVIQSILSRLRSRYRFHQLAINYFGDPHDCGWALYPAAIGGDCFGVKRVRELLRRVRPDLVFLVSDAWVVSDHLEEIFAADEKARVVAYVPVDAGPLDPTWLEHAPNVKTYAVYTRFGRAEIEKALPPSASAAIEIVPHGVDTERFYPLERVGSSATEAKLRLGIIKSPSEPSFVVLNANRNQPRKRIDLTIRGFAEFAKNKPPDVRLYLHMENAAPGWDVLRLSRGLGIEKRLIFSARPDGSHPALKDKTLNLVYNACDVGINTSGGEGWGLVSLEHAAARKAQIVPRHSACEEIWSGAARMLEPRHVMTQPDTHLDFHFTDARDVADALEDLYTNESSRREIADRCHEVATREELSWDAIALRWNDIFQRALGG